MHAIAFPIFPSLPEVKNPQHYVFGAHLPALVLNNSYVIVPGLPDSLATIFSSLCPQTCGIPQGSTVSTLLFFLLWMSPFEFLFEKGGFYFLLFSFFFFYHIHFYLPFLPKTMFLFGLKELQPWIKICYTNLHTNKTESVESAQRVVQNCL